MYEISEIFFLNRVCFRSVSVHVSELNSNEGDLFLQVVS